jgi:hypothetical protein
MATTPRSTAFRSDAPAASYNPASAVTLPLVPLSSSANLVVAVPRSFRPGRNTEVIFSANLPTGVSVGEVVITGSAPSYSANIKLINSTTGNITPTAQIVKLVQE